MITETHDSQLKEVDLQTLYFFATRKETTKNKSSITIYHRELIKNLATAFNINTVDMKHNCELENIIDALQEFCHTSHGIESILILSDIAITAGVHLGIKISGIAFLIFFLVKTGIELNKYFSEKKKQELTSIVKRITQSFELDSENFKGAIKEYLLNNIITTLTQDYQSELLYVNNASAKEIAKIHACRIKKNIKTITNYSKSLLNNSTENFLNYVIDNIRCPKKDQLQYIVNTFDNRTIFIDNTCSRLYKLHISKFEKIITDIKQYIIREQDVNKKISNNKEILKHIYNLRIRGYFNIYAFYEYYKNLGSDLDFINKNCTSKMDEPLLPNPLSKDTEPLSKNNHFAYLLLAIFTSLSINYKDMNNSLQDYLLTEAQIERLNLDCFIVTREALQPLIDDIYNNINKHESLISNLATEIYKLRQELNDQKSKIISLEEENKDLKRRELQDPSSLVTSLLASQFSSPIGLSNRTTRSNSF